MSPRTTPHCRNGAWPKYASPGRRHARGRSLAASWWTALWRTGHSISPSSCARQSSVRPYTHPRAYPRAAPMSAPLTAAELGALPKLRVYVDETGDRGALESPFFAMTALVGPRGGGLERDARRRPSTASSTSWVRPGAGPTRRSTPHHGTAGWPQRPSPRGPTRNGSSPTPAGYAVRTNPGLPPHDKAKRPDDRRGPGP